MPLWELGEQAGLCKRATWLPAIVGFVSPILACLSRFGVGEAALGKVDQCLRRQHIPWGCKAWGGPSGRALPVLLLALGNDTWLLATPCTAHLVYTRVPWEGPGRRFFLRLGARGLAQASQT